MQMKMKTLREKWWSEGVQFPFEIRCGIHTGMANVGNYEWFTDCWHLWNTAKRVAEKWPELELGWFRDGIDAWQEKGYPVELTLNDEQEFEGGFLRADLTPWVASANQSNDGERLFDLLFADPDLKTA